MADEELEPPEPILSWLVGKRTYLVAATILLCGILGECGVTIPQFVWAALAALGLGFLRAGVDEAKAVAGQK
jgi:hypothetical protein